MIHVDGNKLQEVKDHYQKMIDDEILIKEKDGKELSEKEKNSIHNKYTFQLTDRLTQILSWGPKKMFKYGFSKEVNGWREGYTKSTVKSRTEQRRKKNKAARKARRKQNK